jgi:ADP-heptose:LPS heptosyltransferase
MLPNKTNINKDKVKKILIIKLKGIGDVILSTVVLDNLQKDFPDAEIHFLTEPPSLAALEKIPAIKSILLFKKESFLSGLILIFQVFLKRFDLIFDFYSNPRTALITFLSRAKYRAGFPYRGRGYAYNLKGPSVRDKFHAAQLHLEFLKRVGLSFESKELHFGLSEEDKLFSEQFFNDKFVSNDFVVVLSPSGGWQSKKCDPIKFAEIGDEIVKKYNAKILILWGPGDKKEALEISKLMKNKIVLAPLTDIRKMAALIQNCNMIVANDSGPMHIATAVKTPTLSLHGPTNPYLQGPFGDKHEWVRLDELDCIECNLLDCPKNHECFINLPLNRIMEKIAIIISKNKLKPLINETT